MNIDIKKPDWSNAAPAGSPCLADAAALRVRVLDVAQRAFLAQGYELTTVEAIARTAGVAKKTIYAHIGDKAALFAAVVRKLRKQWTDMLNEIVIVPTDPDVALERAAISLIDIGSSSEMIELHRLLLMEARRFPDLINESYDERGALVDMAPLANYLRSAVAKKQLHFVDVDLATEQFVYLVLGGIRTRILRGVSHQPDKATRKRIARQAVSIFLHGSSTQTAVKTTATSRWH